MTADPAATKPAIRKIHLPVFAPPEMVFIRYGGIDALKFGLIREFPGDRRWGFVIFDRNQIFGCQLVDCSSAAAALSRNQLSLPWRGATSSAGRAES